MGDIAVIQDEKVLGMITLRTDGGWETSITREDFMDGINCVCCGYPIVSFEAIFPFLFCMDVCQAFVSPDPTDYFIGKYPDRRDTCKFVGKPCSAHRKDGKCRGKLNEATAVVVSRLLYKGAFFSRFMETMRLYLAVLFMPRFGVTKLDGFRKMGGRKKTVKRFANFLNNIDVEYTFLSSIKPILTAWLSFSPANSDVVRFVSAVARIFTTHLMISRNSYRDSLSRSIRARDLLRSLLPLLRALISFKLKPIRADPSEVFLAYWHSFMIKCQSCYRWTSKMYTRCLYCKEVACHP